MKARPRKGSRPEGAATRERQPAKARTDAWQEAFDKALGQYDSRAQAERIAWAVVMGSEPAFEVARPVKKRVS